MIPGNARSNLRSRVRGQKEAFGKNGQAVHGVETNFLEKLAGPPTGSKQSFWETKFIAQGAHIAPNSQLQGCPRGSAELFWKFCGALVAARF